MEGLQGPMDPCQLHQGFEFLEEKAAPHELYYEGGSFADSFTSFAFSDRMPFLQMLGVEPLSPTSPPSPLPPPASFLRRQHQLRPAVELESCITHASESHSPVKSETKELQYPLGVAVAGEAPAAARWKGGSLGREKRKRKRARPGKNKEEVESQRMTHIAVERNRRKQMNNHLNALRSLMPPSFIQRGDQASIVGGAIDFVKELEQHLQSLEAEKHRRDSDGAAPFPGFFTSPQYRAYSGSLRQTSLAADEAGGGELTPENRAAAAAADVEVTVIQSHVNLKVLSPRQPGQLLKAIVAMEELNLTILHLNVTSLDHSALYSFNLKIEEDCKLASADEIAAAVYQIFSYIITD